jgi:hypothetical protein
MKSISQLIFCVIILSVKANQPNIIFILADDLGEKQFLFFEKLSSSVCLQLHLNYKMFPAYFCLDKY